MGGFRREHTIAFLFQSFNLFKLDMETHTVQDRINELEAKLSFAEDLIDELNRAVYRQQEQIDLLQQQMQLLHQQLQTVMPVEERDLRDEIPPHY